MSTQIEPDNGSSNPYHGQPFADRDLTQLIALSAKLSARYREGLEAEGPSVRHAKWWTMGVGIASLLAQLGGWIWYGGALVQRIDMLEVQAKEAKQSIVELNGDNGRQNVTLGIIGQQYGEISRRLEGIERKLEKR